MALYYYSVYFDWSFFPHFFLRSRWCKRLQTTIDGQSDCSVQYSLWPIPSLKFTSGTLCTSERCPKHTRHNCPGWGPGSVQCLVQWHSERFLSEETLHLRELSSWNRDNGKRSRSGGHSSDVRMPSDTLVKAPHFGITNGAKHTKVSQHSRVGGFC